MIKGRNNIVQAGRVLFFALLVVLCPLVEQGLLSGGASISSSAAYAQEKKKVQPRQITDFTAKKSAKAKTAAELASADSSKPTDEAKAEPDAGNASAQPDAAAKPQDLYAYEAPKEDDASYGWMIFKTIIVLIIFGVGFYMFFKYISKKAGLPNVGRGVVQVLAVSPVGQNRFIQIVDIAGKVMVIGVTEGSINLISEITEKDEIDRVKLLSSKTTPIEAHGFQDFLNEQVSSLIDLVGRAKTSLEKKKRGTKNFEPEEFYDDRKVDYMREQRERLKRMNGYRDDDEK